MQRQHTEWENIFTNDTSDIYKEFIQLNTKKQAIQLENGQRA